MLKIYDEKIFQPAIFYPLILVISLYVQVSMGLLGVITEVTLQCEPAFNLREVRYTVPLDECLDNMDTIVHSGQHVKYWIDVHSEQCAVHVANRTSEPPRDNPNRFILNLQVNGCHVLSCTYIYTRHN